MFTEIQRRELISRLRQPVRLKELRESAEALMKETRYKNGHNFIQALMDEEIIKMHTLRPGTRHPLHVYSAAALSEISPYELAAAILPNGYFCNLSAVYYHGLTNQIPSTVYWCQETAGPRQGRSKQQLTEARIRSAFIKPSRHTSCVIKQGGHEIVIIERTRGTDHGVINVRRQQTPYPAGSRVATLERTLIDAVVSPHYNGGITSVCEHFRAAKGQLNMTRLLETYQKLDFVYPYAQALGFFMEYSGMHDQAEEVRQVYPPRQRFYVDHDAKSSWAYNERWMIFYPKGLTNDD